MLGDIIIIIAPIAPHFASELWAGFRTVPVKHFQVNEVQSKTWFKVKHFQVNEVQSKTWFKVKHFQVNKVQSITWFKVKHFQVNEVSK